MSLTWSVHLLTCYNHKKNKTLTTTKGKQRRLRTPFRGGAWREDQKGHLPTAPPICVTCCLCSPSISFPFHHEPPIPCRCCDAAAAHAPCVESLWRVCCGGGRLHDHIVLDPHCHRCTHQHKMRRRVHSRVQVHCPRGRRWRRLLAHGPQRIGRKHRVLQ